MFKPGKSGNPKGRPVGSKNKLSSDADLKRPTRASDLVIKKQGKRYGPEAVANVVQFMRDAKNRVNSFKEEEEYIVSQLKEDLEKDEKDTLKASLRGIRVSISKEEDKYYKASLKIIDVSHGLVMHDDKMKNKPAKDTIPVEEEEEEDTPIISLVALTPKAPEA